jgi:pimeloyl-ACP methyl ester carboxylesterase
VKNRLHFLPSFTDRPDLPLLIYLPGMDGTGQMFYKQIDGLKQFFNIRCLAIPSDDLSNWDTLATQMIKLIEKEVKHITSSIYLCGESFGGCLALLCATKAPWLFEKLILINSASSFSQRSWLSLSIPITKSMPDFIYPYSTLFILPFLAALDRITNSDRQALLNAMKSLPSVVVSWRIALLHNFAISPQKLSRLTQPILLVASASDRLLPSVEDAKDLLSVLPCAKLAILPYSGHACLIEKDINLSQLLQTYQFVDTQNIKKSVLQ